MSDLNRHRRWVRVLLLGLPLWLAISAGFAVWLYFNKDENAAEEAKNRFSKAVTPPMIQDDLQKFVEVIGERNTASESAAANLGRAASMIEGLLGPSNTGFTIFKERGPKTWPILYVTVAGKFPGRPAIWVVASYDSRPGSRGAEANASGTAATIAAAQALASDQLERSVYFAFVPHGNDPTSPVTETVAALRELITTKGGSAAVLCVEAMGNSEELQLSSPEPAASALDQVEGLANIVPAKPLGPQEQADLSSHLAAAELPAVRVATRARLSTDEPDERTPFAGTAAIATDKLIELIRRCGNRR